MSAFLLGFCCAVACGFLVVLLAAVYGNRAPSTPNPYYPKVITLDEDTIIDGFTIKAGEKVVIDQSGKPSKLAKTLLAVADASEKARQQEIQYAYRQADEARKMTRNATIEECARFVENGSFLHEDAPGAIFARQCADAMREQMK